MASLDLATIDIIFLEHLQEWLKAHPSYWLEVNGDYLEVKSRNHSTAEIVSVEYFDNANQLLEWIRKDIE